MFKKLLAGLAIAAVLVASVNYKATAQVLGTAMAYTVQSLVATATTNQLVLGTTNTTTISAPAPSSSITLTMPSAQSDTLMGTHSGSSYSAIQSSASLGGSPVTLTAAQCGGAFALDAATGVVYILPSTLPAAGCTYDFYVTTSVTSNSHEIESGNAAHFFQGSPFMLSATATALFTGTCNGSSHIAYKTNGTTTGGLIGTHLRAVVLSATNVLLDGWNFGSGSLATACSASN